MYYITSRVWVQKNGSIVVEAADSNVYPLYFFKSPYRGTLAEFLKSADEGNFHLYSGANPRIEEALKRIDAISKSIYDYGITYSIKRLYGLDDYNKIMDRACEYEAFKILKKLGVKDLSPVEKPNIDLLIAEAVFHLDEAKKKAKEESIIFISAAAKSIFKGYDLLFPLDGTSPLLAPEEYYDGAGKLRAPEDKIIKLGEEAEDLYAFLSFTGTDLDRDRYATMFTTVNLDKFDRCDRIIERCINLGLKLEHAPYAGYALEAAA